MYYLATKSNSRYGELKYWHSIGNWVDEHGRGYRRLERYEYFYQALAAANKIDKTNAWYDWLGIVDEDMDKVVWKVKLKDY